MGLYSFTIKWFVCPTKEFKRLGDFVTKLFSIAEAAAEAAVSFRIDEIALEAPAPDRLLRDFASNSSHLISEPVSASIDLKAQHIRKRSRKVRKRICHFQPTGCILTAGVGGARAVSRPVSPPPTHRLICPISLRVQNRTLYVNMRRLYTVW